MAGRSPVLTLLLLSVAAPVARGAPAMGDSASVDSARVDSARTPPRIVRHFPPIEVSATLHDPSSSETVHLIPGSALHTLPVDGFADALALQPGVVAQGEELHVRGGRPGETTTFLDGISLNESRRQKAMELPILGIRSVDLVSGSPEAQYGAGLAGAVILRTVDPPDRPSLAWRWQIALEKRWYDRWSARLGTPLRVLGLGVVAAGDFTLDDGWLPSLRSEREGSWAGVRFDWRADNRALGWIKLAPIEQPQRFSAQVLLSRHLQRPFDPAWTAVDWISASGTPGTPGYQPAHIGYIAADHLAVTDERQIATLVSLARLRPAGRTTLSLGWLRTRAVTSVSGARGLQDIGPPASFVGGDGFHVVFGDDPLYRVSGSDVLTVRADGEVSNRLGRWIKAGAGATYEDVTLIELDRAAVAVDPVREYHAFAPGGFGYVQGRWQAGGLVMNTGLRADYFTAGPEAKHQTIPWDGRGVVSLSPRLGFAYPVSVRDAFSLAYSRIHQAPGRDFLYDHRQAINNRQPLGNPNLSPSTVISYEAALKHTFNLAWALQASLFYRDVFGQVGMRNFSPPGLPDEVRYTSQDDAQAAGTEWSLIHSSGERRRVELHYTYMEAWGLESRPEGDPYGPVVDVRATPIGQTPLSWDRRHSLTLAATWSWKDDWLFSWSTAVGSPLPWTPKPRRVQLVDLSLVNSRRFDWTELTNLNVQWTPAFAHGVTIGFESRNLFDNRSDRVATVDGYPNPVINTVFDDYGAYRTETGRGGGAYWVATGSGTGYWMPVNDPRLLNPPRALRLSVGANW